MGNFQITQEDFSFCSLHTSNCCLISFTSVNTCAHSETQVSASALLGFFSLSHFELPLWSYKGNFIILWMDFVEIHFISTYEYFALFYVENGVVGRAACPGPWYILKPPKFLQEWRIHKLLLITHGLHLWLWVRQLPSLCIDHKSQNGLAREFRGNKAPCPGLPPRAQPTLNMFLSRKDLPDHPIPAPAMVRATFL